jgi:immune inhibitor A
MREGIEKTTRNQTCVSVPFTGALFCARLIVGTLVALVALSALVLPLWAVPIRPDLIQELKERGDFEEFIARQRRIEDDAYERGLNMPSARCPFESQGWPVTSADTIRLRALLLLVDFDDNPADSLTYPVSYYDSLLFSVGQNPWGSMREYFLENSGGKLDVRGVTVGWYRMPELYSYYVDGKRGLGSYPHNAQKLVEDAVKAADWDINFSNFDNDGPDGIPDSGDDDGYLDALFIAHAGPGYEETVDTTDIHSHKWVLLFPLVVDGVIVRPYTMQPENGKTGVFCHEFGHDLGLPDLYDRDYSSRGLGGWSLMAFGVWNAFGLRPSHLDAWSKIKVGFATPVVPTTNVEDVSFPPVELEPVIYKLWDSGTGDWEYFLAERREKVGFDDYLPGTGLLIYHVDETVGNNDRAFHYKVALEQADGQWNLESNVNVGDDGDPFPGSSGKTVFGYETTPGSVGYGGIDSRVRVFNIASADTQLTADIWVQQGPKLSVSRFTVTDSAGNLDGNADPGETVSLKLYLWNAGSDAADAMGILVPRSGAIRMINSSAQFGTIRLNSERWSSPSFTFEVSDTISVDPFAGWFDLFVWTGPGYTTEDSLLVGVGDALGLQDDMESPVGWHHYPVHLGWNDEWHLSDARAFEGNSSWACAKAGSLGYSPRNEAALESPVVLVGSDSKLVFYHWMDAQANQPAAFDGGFVEISSNGSPWTQLEPVGGYQYWLVEQEGVPGDNIGVYSGTSSEWERAEFNLGAYSHSAVRLRFRFVSNSDALGGEGWFIDSLTVITSPTPVWIGSLTAEETQGCVTISWRAAGELGGAPFSVWRSPGPDGEPGVYKISEEPVVSRNSYEFRDCSVLEGKEYTYWVGVEGSPGLLHGPVTILVSGKRLAVPRLELKSPNPATRLVKMALSLPQDGADGDVWLRVFDVSGRAVRTLYRCKGAVGDEPIQLQWDMKDYSGKRVSSGVYFLRLEWPHGILTRKVVALVTSGRF